MQSDLGKEDGSLDQLNQLRAVIYWEEIESTGQVGPAFVFSFFVSFYLSLDIILRKCI